jgi:hypothetical protein
VDEYALYEKYAKVFPNVEIQFSDDVTLSPAAASIKFYTDKNKSDVYYSVKGKTDGSQTLESLTSTSGPTGIAMPEPIKPSTNRETFTFVSWKNCANDEDVSLETEVT